MRNPTTCFALTRHNNILPLKIVDTDDMGDGCFLHHFEINLTNPSDYLKTQFNADFRSAIVSADSPLIHEHGRIRATLKEATELALFALEEEKKRALNEVISLESQMQSLSDEADRLTNELTDKQ